jgi:hypothetical protein
MVFRLHSIWLHVIPMWFDHSFDLGRTAALSFEEEQDQAGTKNFTHLSGKRRASE